MWICCSVMFDSVTPWTAACQASLSFPISWILLRFMSIELALLSISSSAAPFSCCLQSFPASGSFPIIRLFASGGQSIGTSAPASVLPMNVQGWFPLGLIGLISSHSKGLSTVLSSTTILQCSAFSMVQLSHSCITTRKITALTIWNFVRKVLSSLLNMPPVSHSFSSKEQESFHFIAAGNDFGAQENKICHCFYFFLIYLPWSDRTRCHDLCF